MVDYLIVGCGLGGIAFAETARQAGKTVVVVDRGDEASSAVAAGLYNPVILKRFSGLQQAQEQLHALQEFYTHLEARLGIQVNFPMPIWRKFHSTEEQNDWFAASDKPSTKDFMSPKLHFDQIAHIAAPFGYGEVLQSGYVDTRTLLEAYRNDLKQQDSLLSETFDYALLQMGSFAVQYKHIHARQLVFAEGFGIRKNPFFTPMLNGTKGELLLIKAEALELDVVLKAGLFVLPMGQNLFKVGATYEWKDKTAQITASGRAELIEKLDEIIDCKYEIVQQWAGIRPTTPDRKAIIGTHPTHSRMHVLNGLGTRGVMLAPYMAQLLLQHIEKGTPIPEYLDLARFQ